MGTRTMGSHDELRKQGRLYNLTLDEVQHKLGDLGKPLSSMNIDELIKSVWSVESGNANLASASAVAGVSKKTVDELWQDMKKGVDGGDRKSVCEKQPRLGEMTLEDFLAKAGIVAESESHEKKDLCSGSENCDMGAFPQQNVNPQWLQYQMQNIQQQHAFVPGHHPAQQMVGDVAYTETQMTISSDTQTSGRKRVASGDLMEKSVERRQKRMIKNRESAARSRARKQVCFQHVYSFSVLVSMKGTYMEDRVFT